ncbi:MAG: hypothetical protein IJA08_05205 [Clostridia bacterium]|nr:hypothetical protein [Clostridia bacterium]
MDVRELIKKEFLAPFYRDGRNYVGVELEFPLVFLEGEPKKEAALGLFYELLEEKSFRVAETDTDGVPAFIKNDDGDVLSFDNSYHNFEFSLEKNESLIALSERFYRLFRRVQEYFLPRGMSLCGLGTHPMAEKLCPLPVPFPVYEMVGRFLSQFSGGEYHQYTQFPQSLSSVQTHLDVTADRLPRALTLYAALDFVRALLFSNSPAFINETAFSDCVCFRDYLWEKSGFGSLCANTGKVEGEFRTMDDVCDGILSRAMFYRVRGGEYELIKPQPLRKYFAGDAPKADVDYYLSFCNVEVTRRGTLEVRSDCAQQVSDAFGPPAFNLGLLSELDTAEEILLGFLRTHLTKEEFSAPDRNQKLRDAVIYHYRLPASREDTRTLLLSLVELAENGLKKRQKGEEVLLSPLFLRAENLRCPAMDWMDKRTAGASLKDLVLESVKVER